MFFLIRCAFWLTIVFTSIPWPRESGVPALLRLAGLSADSQALLQAKLASVLLESSQASMAELKAFCMANPQACLDGLAKIGALQGEGQVSALLTANVNQTANVKKPSEQRPAH